LDIAREGGVQPVEVMAVNRLGENASAAFRPERVRQGKLCDSFVTAARHATFLTFL